MTTAEYRFWTPTRIAGAALAACGVVAALVTVATKGVTPASEAQLITFVTIVLAGAGAFAVPSDGVSSAARALQMVCWMVAALALVNVAMAWIGLGQWAWRAPAYFPSMSPIGADFRAGAYEAARHFSNAGSAWPPFTVVLGLPYLLLREDAAYVVHVCVLIALNVAAVWTAVSVVRTRDDGGAPLCGATGTPVVGLLAPAFAVWLFLASGFLLSLERGNIDAFPAFVAMLGLWSMVRRPTSVWIPAIAFSLAAEIKVYPAVLFLLLIWRFRWKSILPLVVCNLILALSAGPRNLTNYVHSGTRSMAQGADWVGNSSAHSFSTWVTWLRPSYLLQLPVSLLIAIPLVVLALTAGRLWSRRDHSATVLMFCAMIPLMCAVPSVSHDYKVVLFAGPAVLLVALLLRHVGRGTAESWWMLLTLLLALFMIARAPGQLVDYSVNVERFIWPAVLMNKYPAILLFQCVVAWMAWRLPARRTAPLPGDTGNDAAAS